MVSAVFGGREMKMKGGSLLLASLAPGWLIGCVINVGLSDLCRYQLLPALRVFP